YWIENNHFILTTGVLNKERKELNISRIQSVDTTEGFVNQIVGGVELIIKTPSDGIELSTISKKQSVSIESEIKNIQQQLNATHQAKVNVDSEKDEDEDNESLKNVPTKSIFKMSFKQLLFMAMTSGAIGITLITLSPIVGSFSDIIPWEKLGGELSYVLKSTFFIIIAIVVVVLIMSYIIGTCLAFIRYYGYKVTQQGHQLKIQYGLFTKKNVTVPTNRLQGVLEHQSYIRRLFGYTSIHFYITSDIVTSAETSDVNGRIMILPFIKRQQAYEVIQALVPEMRFNTAHTGMPLRGFHRHFLIPSLILIIASFIGWYFWSKWSFAIAVLLIILLIIRAVLYVRYSGYYLENEEIVIQKASLLNMKRFYFKLNKVIGMEIRQHPLLERKHLANFKFIIAKGFENKKIGLKYTDVSKVNEFKEWYMRGDTHE
ncbi:PH domain-containing protein, partial [Staphylococcus capitis]